MLCAYEVPRASASYCDREQPSYLARCQLRESLALCRATFLCAESLPGGRTALIARGVWVMEFRLQGVRRARLGRGWCPGLGEIQTPLGLKNGRGPAEGARVRESNERSGHPDRA